MVGLRLRHRRLGRPPGNRGRSARMAGGLLPSLLICLGLASPLGFSSPPGLPSPVQAQSGWYLMTDIESAESVTVREVLISGGKVKTLPRDEVEPWLLIDLESREIIFVDPAQQAYAQATPASHCAALTEAGEALGSLMPPRFYDDEALGPAEGGDPPPNARDAGDIRIRKVGGNTQVGDFEAARYDISLGGTKLEEVYLATDERLLRQLGGLEGVAAYVTILHELDRCARDVLGEKASRLSAAEHWTLEERPEYLEMMKTGWPVKTSWRGEPSRRDETVTISSEWSVQPTDFDPPASYRRVSITEMLLPQVR